MPKFIQLINLSPSLSYFVPRPLFLLTCSILFGWTSAWSQDSSLPSSLRVLYESFDVSAENLDGVWWLEMPGLIEGTDLPIYASMDEENDLFIGVLIGQNDLDVQAAYAQTESINRWSAGLTEDGELMLQTWIFKTSEEDILLEFILSVAELSDFLQNAIKDSSSEGFLFDVAGCVNGIERSLADAPIDYQSMLNPQSYCACLAELVVDDPDLLFAMMDITSPESIEAMRACWSDFCPRCASIGVSFEQAMLGLQGDSDAVGEINSIGRNKFISGCVKGFLLEERMDVEFTLSQIETSCECLYDRVLRQDGMTMEEYLDPNGVIYNEMLDECMPDLYELQVYLNEGARPRGCTGSIRLPVLRDMSGTWKVKVNLGVSEKYLMLDTGASELVINQDWADELKAQGILSNAPIDHVSFIMADDREVFADIYVASRMSFGACDFYDFKVAVLPEGGMLCGMGVLSLFSSWQIDEGNRELVLRVD